MKSWFKLGSGKKGSEKACEKKEEISREWREAVWETKGTSTGRLESWGFDGSAVNSASLSSATAPTSGAHNSSSAPVTSAVTCTYAPSDVGTCVYMYT